MMNSLTMEHRSVFGRLNEHCELIIVYRWIDPVSLKLMSKEQHPAWLSKATLRGYLKDLGVEITPQILALEKIDLADLLENAFHADGRLEI